jgi:hypothetical protein
MIAGLQGLSRSWPGYVNFELADYKGLDDAIDSDLDSPFATGRHLKMGS